MASKTWFKPWLPICVLIIILANLAIAASQPKKRTEKGAVKLPAILAAKPLKEGPNDDAMRKLLKARYNEAVSEARDFYVHERLAGENAVTLRSDADHFYGMWRRILEAGLEICDKPSEKVTLLTQYLEITKEIERLAQARHDAGRIRIGDLHRARYERLDAEIRLRRAEREGDMAKDK